MLRAVLAALLLWAPQALAGESGFASRDIELRAEPLSGAPVVGRLSKHTRFEIVAEQKAWSQVKAGELSGWTLTFYVLKGEPAPQVSTGRRLSELFSLGTERRAETTATIGVRGLDEEQLKSAQFNEPELKRLEAYGLPRGEGDAFARRAELQPQKVDYLAPLSQ